MDSAGRAFMEAQEAKPKNGRLKFTMDWEVDAEKALERRRKYSRDNLSTIFCLLFQTYQFSSACILIKVSEYTFLVKAVHLHKNFP